MCGSNSRKESDRRPLWFCPECNAKVCWATQQKPIERYQKLQAFCKQHGFKEDAAFYAMSIQALQKHGKKM